MEYNKIIQDSMSVF